MKKFLFATTILILPFIFSGCEKKKTTTEKVPEQTVQEETNSNAQNQEIAESENVPLPQEEDIVRLFFNLINEKRIPEAVAMMDASAAPDDNAKQAWGVQFDIFNSVSVKSVEPSNIGDETEGQKTYKVILDANNKPGSEKAVIPNYGWENGENIRWVGLKKDESGMWKILGIGTGS